MMRTGVAWFILAALMLHSTGCGYRLTSHGGLSGRKVAIPVFANKSLRPNLDSCLTSRLVSVFAAETGGHVVPSGQADLELSGAILSYRTAASAYSASDVEVMYRATLAAEATLRDLKSGTVVWKGSVLAHQEYPGNSDLALQVNAEDAAKNELCRKLADDILRQSGNSF
jgi:outer membrane lipopolysaccharide assembly protein LptE/RlpB